MDERRVCQSEAAGSMTTADAGSTAVSGSRPLSRRGLLGTIAGLTTGMIASWAAACGAGGGAVGIAEAPRLTKENITLRLSAWGSQEEADVWQKVADAYSAKRPNIKVSFEHYPSSYEQKVYSLAVAGDAPHVMSIQDEPFPEFVTKGLYMDITALAKRDAKEMNFDDFWPRWLDMFRWDESLQRTNVSSGKLYAIPWDGGNILWFYNKDAFDRYGVPYPKKDWTWEDSVDTCRKLTRRSPDGSAQQVAYNWPGTVYSMPFIWTLGQDYLYLDKDYKKCELDKPGSFFAHEQLWRLAHDWKVVRLSTDFQGEQNLFETGKYAMMITGPWAFPGLRRYQGETGWQNWDIAPMWTYKGKRQTRQTPDAVANWSQTKSPEEGWDLIKFITGEEGQRMFSQLGRGMPARRSLAKSADFARPDTPQHEEYFVEAMDYSGYQPVTKYWGDMWKIIGKFYGEMMNPAIKRKPETFLPKMAQDITQLLQTGQLPTDYS